MVSVLGVLRKIKLIQESSSWQGFQTHGKRRIPYKMWGVSENAKRDRRDWLSVELMLDLSSHQCWHRASA